MAKDNPNAARDYAETPGRPEPGTLVQLFFRACGKLGERDAFMYKSAGTWRSIPYADIEERVRRLGLGLEALGVQRGDRVALLSENRPEWLFTDYACLCTGAILVPLYATLPAGQIRYMLENSEAKVVLVSNAEQRDKILEIRASLPALQKIVVFDELQTEDRDVLTLGQVIDLGRRQLGTDGAEGFRERALTARPEDIATILYTSGTTGTPKGVMLTHDNIHSNVAGSGEVLPLGPGDVALSFLPLSHILERMVDYTFFERGCTIAFAESLEKIPENLREVRPTIVASTPRLYEKFHARVMAASGVKGKLVHWAARVGDRWATAKLEGRDPGALTRAQHALADRLVYRKIREGVGGRLRCFISGGAPLSPEIGRFFYAAGVVILEGYGLTETSPVTNVNRPDSVRMGTVGPPLPGTAIRIAPDGEILVKGPQVMKGYYENPEATAEVLDEEGWFRTGDIGELDEDGFLRITDRKKDIIVTAGGKNVAPAPIEQAVKMHPFVEEAVMLGDRRPYTIMLVVPDFGAVGDWARAQGIDTEDPRALVEDERVQQKLRSVVFATFRDLARFETPKRLALLTEGFTVEAGELTPSLKVKRRVVERKHAATIEAVYEGEREVVPEVAPEAEAA